MKMPILTANNFAQMKKMVLSGNNYMLLSSPGSGKTTLARDFATYVMSNFGFVEMILSQREGIDIRGIPVPQRDPNGGRPTTITTISELQRAVEEQIAAGAKGGLIWLDEYYQAQLDVRKAVSQLLPKPHMLDDWKLPEGWVIWGASNPPEWRAGTVPPMGHEKSRWIELNIAPHPDSWHEWGHKNDIHPLYMAFAKEQPHQVFSTEPPKDRNAPHCNPRSLVMAHDYHVLGAGDGGFLEASTDSVDYEVVSGSIGQGAARALFTYMRVQDVMPTAAEMLADPTGCKVPPKERIDARYACMMQAVHYASPETNEALFEFVKRLDKEMTVSSIKHFVKKSPQSLNAPNISKFIAENPESAMALAR